MIKIGGEGHPSPWNALTKPINVFEICHISISRTTDSTYRTVARVHNMQIASVSGYGGRNRHNDERMIWQRDLLSQCLSVESFM